MTPINLSASRCCRDDFLALLPDIERTARSSCCRLDPEARDDAVAETIADAFVAFARLAESGRADVATPASLARFGLRHYFAGRRVGSRLNSRDVLSHSASKRHAFQVERLDERAGHEWMEVLVEDRTATPADLAASRIDFPAWLDSLPARDRRIALKLAAGHSSGEVAKRFRLSAARVSQLRRELERRWRAFHERGSGEPRRGLAGAG